MTESWRFFPALLWAVYVSAVLQYLLGQIERWRRPYKQAGVAALGEEGWRRRQERDSRGLRRMMRVMDRGASLIRVEQTYWDRLDRRLGLMGKKAAGRETLALLMLRCLLYALPALSLPVLLGGWWKALFYPVAVAVLFRQEVKSLDRQYGQWQKSLVRDIPEVMDRLRICFASGRDYLSALRQAQSAGGPAMGRVLSQLIHDIQSMGSAAAFRLFSLSFDLPAVQKLASALMLAVESGYGAAEAYFNSIEGELTALRQEAAEALTKSKPEKVYQLYGLLFALAVGALLLKGWEIFQQVGRLFVA
ncbi:MAG: hypothetical protein LBK98_08500 [Peptococcaceae bacterium]|jgi:hypothetical protein|nr:hypothetical protein [Peptococcaceae bacterium]